MSVLSSLIGDLVTANHILAAQGVVDAFGHVSFRHPENPARYFLARARAPELITQADILEFQLDGTPIDPAGGKPYLERYIHGAIYEQRPDIGAVVHSHSRSVVPFSVTGTPIRPLMHSCATIGDHVPVWDAQDKFGDTTLLITSMEMGRDLVRVMGDGPSALMRGHGSTVAGATLREAVYTAVYLEVNAELQIKASQIGAVKFLTAGEAALIRGRLADAKPGEGYDRAWEYWASHTTPPPA